VERKNPSYENDNFFVRSTSRDHRGDDSTSLRNHDHDHAVREADAESRGRRSGVFRHGHDKDGDDGRLLALHARRFYTDVKSRHANTSGKRDSLVPYLAAGKDVKSDGVQSGMDQFVDRSRKLRLREGW
jgi:hypothetical protein